MATGMFDAIDRTDAEQAPSPQPMLALVHDANNYSDLERTAPGVATRGLHPGVLGILVAIYATMLLSFWALFVRNAEAALVMVAVTVLMIMYFSLLVGGIVLADTPDPRERQRNFADFMRGPVEILNGVISGREAAIQILFLPAAMMVLAVTIGIIARSTLAGGA